MTDDFLIARNPEEDSRLPYLVRLPLGRDGAVLKARETWPRTAKVYCHPSDAWPAEPEIIERVPVRSCVRRGASIDLILDRGRENRSQFVFTTIRGGREAIFWQSARTAKQSRPSVSVPRARASGVSVVDIAIDVHERYPWGFTEQQVATVREKLPAGDYAVRRDGRVVAIVERKSLDDLVSTLLSGKLKFLLAELSAGPPAAVVVEARYADVFKLDRVRPAVVADGLGECQVRFGSVPIVFADTRKLAQEWTYRFFGAALSADAVETTAMEKLRALPGAGEPVPAPKVTTAVVRRWAREHGIEVPPRGKLRPEVWEAYRRERP